LPDTRTGGSAPASLSSDQVATILRDGSLELVGRLVAASNASFLAKAILDGVTLECVYKPVAGERPLWDFPDGSLAARERAAYVVSEAGGWHVVPTTVLRDDARFGRGMVQHWVETDPDESFLEVVSPHALPEGWKAVVEAEDGDGNDVVLVHPDDPRLRSLAVFDVVVNNADRKGGHLLPDPQGRLFGCDHGVTFHVDPKLRTVLWGWAGHPLRDEDDQRLDELQDWLAGDAESRAELTDLLGPDEVRALVRRVRRLLDTGAMPVPGGGWPSIPWPAW
jgi:uncharacterized repeat protein (TIGR03843 family)